MNSAKRIEALGDGKDAAERVVQWQFTWRKIALFFSALAWAAYFATLLLAVAGNAFFSMRPFVLSSKASSFLLFPGSETHPIVDLLYIVALILGALYLPICWQVTTDNAPKTFLNRQLKPTEAALLALCIAVLLHVFGNLHYQCYYYFGVVPDANHFALYDIRSFACGPAGLVLAAAACGVSFCAVIYPLWYTLSGRLCFEEVVIDEPIDAKNEKLAAHLPDESV